MWCCCCYSPPPSAWRVSWVQVITTLSCGTGWYGVCCRHGRGQLQGAALQSGDRGLARGLPGPRPLLLGVRILPRPGQVTWSHVITRDTRATCCRWSQGEFRDCSGESNGSPLPLSVLTLEYLETLAGRPAAEDSLLLGR